MVNPEMIAQLTQGAAGDVRTGAALDRKARISNLWFAATMNAMKLQDCQCAPCQALRAMNNIMVEEAEEAMRDAH